MPPGCSGGIFWRKMKKDTIIKFLNNSCTDAELNEIIHWANEDALNEVNKKWAFEDWDSYQLDEDFGDDEKFSILFDKIQQKIDIDYRKHKISKNKSSKFYLITSRLTRAATILLIPVLTFLFYTISQNNSHLANYSNLTVDSLEITAPIGSRTMVQLSDGSKVYLNYGSKLKYPQNFTGDTREVMLSGEGYFDVTHNPEKPFIVITEKLNIKALGTIFNVQAYPSAESISTTLVDGKVAIEQKEANGYNKSIGTMVPGQHVNYNVKTEHISCTKGNIDKYIAWKDGKIVFEDTPITQVANRLNKMFNVEIEVSNDIKDYIYTVTLVDEPLFQILDLMAIATPISYNILPRKKLPDGTFSKQKINIEKRNK